MSWVCPKCGRPFKNTNQQHSCVQLSVEEHLKGKPAELVAAYQKLALEVEKLGDVVISPVKSAIQFKSKSTFLSCKVGKTYLEIEFFLETVSEEFPVLKTLRLSAKKVVHYVRVESAKEIDKQLLNWIKTSCRLVNGS